MKIRSEQYVLQNNKEAFERLAAAAVPIQIARSSNSSGNPIPSGYFFTFQMPKART